MKTYLKTILCFSALGLLTAPAHAADAPSGFFFKPTVGADYQYTGVNYESNLFGTGVSGSDLASESLNGVNVHVGARVHKYLGFEAGYLWTDNADKSNILGTGLDSKVNVKGFNFDVLGYLPVDDAGKFELIGTVGVSRLKASFSIPTIGSTDDTETKGRFGGGAQYWLTDNINVRGLVRYQGADFGGTVKDAVTANLGLNFQF